MADYKVVREYEVVRKYEVVRDYKKADAVQPKKVEEKKVDAPVDDAPVDDSAADDNIDVEAMTKAEIKDMLDDMDVEYSNTANKAELVALLEENL